MSEEYIDFVNSVTSKSTKNQSDLLEALDFMEEQGATPSRLLTTALGLNGEASEFSELIKKCIFQGREYTDEVHAELKSELSDIMWYIAQACIALGISLEDVLDTNTQKLEARYPDGFEAFRAENRKEGDI